MVHQIAVICLIFSQVGKVEAPQFVYPVASREIVEHYLAPATKYSPGHRGIDQDATPNEEILAPVSGFIGFTGKVGYRDLVTIKFSDREITLEPVCGTLQENSPVGAGDVIGNFCEPDPEYKWHCLGCIHFGLKTPNGYLSPELYLGGLTPSRLLP
ncbi:MAG: hypothetical protein EBT82_02525 [Micrococcales bacterium]|nr:hypothetical protein [Micrococcales bacterium]NBR54842.1 hypothetical protein [Micrococcales bacterium]NBR61213.1 hypothetical protein [Actinomycetota bacterium]NBT47168.1 hypothetical protein [Actinomycetota bacterium]NBY43469.1 hypothetical protein [Micrococcales bacterium]